MPFVDTIDLRRPTTRPAHGARFASDPVDCPVDDLDGNRTARWVAREEDLRILQLVDA